jgi:hypothetical protein
VPTYMPRGHDPSRRLWRGMAGVLAHRMRAQVRSATSQPPARPPQVIEWLSRLAGQGLPPAVPITLHAVGVSYGTQDSPASTPCTTTNSPSPIAVASDPALRQSRHRRDAVCRGRRLAGLGAARLQPRSRRRAEPSRGPASVRGRPGYDRLEHAYAGWLAHLGPGSDPDARLGRVAEDRPIRPRPHRRRPRDPSRASRSLRPQRRRSTHRLWPGLALVRTQPPQDPSLRVPRAICDRPRRPSMPETEEAVATAAEAGGPHSQRGANA